MSQSVIMKVHKGICFRRHVAAPENCAQLTYGEWRQPKEAARLIIIPVGTPPSRDLIRRGSSLDKSCDCSFQVFSRGGQNLKGFRMAVTLWCHVVLLGSGVI